MEWLSFAALTTPSVVFSIAAGLFLVLVRSPWPWTRAGGAFLGLLCSGLFALALRNSELRETALDHERFPVLVMVAGSCCAVWLALHQFRRRQSRPAMVAFDDLDSTWRGVDQAELLLSGAVIVAVAVAAFFLGAPLVPVSVPSEALAVTAPWFMLGLQELASYFDPWVPWLLLPLLTILGLWTLPYLDAETGLSEEQDLVPDGFNERRDVVYFFLFIWFLLALLPMATAFHPTRPDVVRPDLARPLSEMLWSLVRENPPRMMWLRELPALMILGFYFVVLPRRLPRWKRTRVLFGRYVKRLGPRRFYLAMTYMQIWMLVPIKMYCLWLLNIGYFVYLPELSFNF